MGLWNQNRQKLSLPTCCLHHRKCDWYILKYFSFIFIQMDLHLIFVFLMHSALQQTTPFLIDNLSDDLTDLHITFQVAINTHKV